MQILPAFIDTPMFHHAANYTRRTLKPVRPIYTAEKVAGALMSAVCHPRRGICVGTSARLAVASHVLTPALTERVMARVVDSAHFGDEVAADTSGNVLYPVDGPATISGGWKPPWCRHQAADIRRAGPAPEPRLC